MGELKINNEVDYKSIAKVSVKNLTGWNIDDIVITDIEAYLIVENCITDVCRFYIVLNQIRDREGLTLI